MFKKRSTTIVLIFKAFFAEIDASELERLKKLYKGENKKRQSLREGREKQVGIVFKEMFFQSLFYGVCSILLG